MVCVTFGVATHQQRLQAARDAVNFICQRDQAELTRPVPNCPGWTVYNAAVHIGRVAVAWKSMIEAAPDDPDSRVRGYAEADARGSGHSVDALASWAHEAIDALEADVDREAYFSMTGGRGTIGLWAWHAASELGIHRIDVAQALGIPHGLDDALAIDALHYTCDYFLPAMARVSEAAPGAVEVVAKHGYYSEDDPLARFELCAPEAAEVEPAVTISGPPIEVLAALWNRGHELVVISGDDSVLQAWQSLPGQAFQFGTWD